MSTEQDFARDQWIFREVARLSATQLKATGDLMRLYEQAGTSSSDQLSRDRLDALWTAWRAELDNQIGQYVPTREGC